MQWHLLSPTLLSEKVTLHWYLFWQKKIYVLRTTIHRGDWGQSASRDPTSPWELKKVKWSFQAHWQGRKTSMSVRELRNNCLFNPIYVAWAQAHFLSLSWPWAHLLIWLQSSCANWPCNLPAFSSCFQQKPRCLWSSRRHPHARTFPMPLSLLLLPSYLAWAPHSSHWFGVGVGDMRRDPAPHPWHQPDWDPVLTLLPVGLCPCHLPSGTSSPRKALGVETSSSCWSAGPHIFTHPRRAPRPKRMRDFRCTMHYITLWVFPWSRSTVTLWRRQQHSSSFPKSAGTFPLTLISI